MANLGECVNRILEPLFLTGEYTAGAKTAIKTATDFYKRKLFWFNEEMGTGVTISGTERYAFPADFGDLLTLNITINNNNYPLRRRTSQEMDNLYVSAAQYSGYPQDFSIEKNAIRLGPIPNGAYTLKIYYRKEPATATADSQTNIFLTNAEPLIRWKAAADIAFNYRRDTEAAQGFLLQADMELKNHQSESLQKQMKGSGRRR